MGVWREHKNLARLFEAFSKLKSEHNSAEIKDLELVLTGKPDQELLNRAKQLNILDHLKTVGKVPFEDLKHLVGSATAFVFPSLYEGFGLPPLEAMKSETPVIASDVSAIPEVCGQAAAYFSPYDTNAMVKQIFAVVTDKKLQKILLKAGKKQAEKFNWNTCTQKTWEIYQNTSNELKAFSTKKTSINIE